MGLIDDLGLLGTTKKAYGLQDDLGLTDQGGLEDDMGLGSIPELTSLSDEEETIFQSDYSKYSELTGNSPDPNDPKHYYDYRGAWKQGGGLSPDESGHLSSEFKLEGHPRMVLDGVNTKTGEKVFDPKDPRSDPDYEPKGLGEALDYGIKRLEKGIQDTKAEIGEYGTIAQQKWRKGYHTVYAGENWGEAMLKEKGIDEAAVREEELNTEYGAYPDDTPDFDKHALKNIWGAGAEMAPFMFEAGKAGAKGAVKGMTMGALVGLAAGGPDPSDIAVIPAGAKVGSVVGTIDYSMRVEGGNIFGELIKRGVDEDVARGVSIPAGIMIGAIESLQIDQALTSPLRRLAAKKLMKNPTIKKAIKDAIFHYGKTYMSELAEEDLQKIVENTGILVGELIDGKITSEDINGKYIAGRIIKDLGQETIQAGKGLLLLPLGGSVAVGGKVLSDKGKIAKIESQKLEDDIGLQLAEEKKGDKFLFAGEKAEGFKYAEGKFTSRADKKERFEIDDSAATLGEGIPEKGQTFGEITQSLWEKNDRPIKLSDVLAHEGLYKAYPEMKEIRVTSRPVSQGEGAHFNRTTGTISVSRGTEMHDVKSLLLHEIQHVIQRKEVFASGGSPRQFQIAKDEAMARIDFLNSLMSESAKKLDDTTISKEEKATHRKQYDEALGAKLDIDPMIVQADTYDQYRKLAGEVEARDVQARKDLTPEQRREKPPLESQGIKLEDMIVKTDAAIAESAKDLAKEAKKHKTVEDFVASTKEAPGNAIERMVEQNTEIPPMRKLPESGQFAAVRTTDGSIFYDDQKGGRTHFMMVEDQKIPPHKLKDGGWLKDGVYEPTGRSDTISLKERAQAIEAVNKHIKQRLTDIWNKAQEKGETKRFYHVTFTDNVDRIKKEGIVPQKEATFTGQFGQDLRGKGTVFAFDNFDDAARWAYKQKFDTGRETSVISFEDTEQGFEEDMNAQIQLSAKGKGLQREGTISAETIKDVTSIDEGYGRKLVESGRGVPLQEPKYKRAEEVFYVRIGDNEVEVFKNPTSRDISQVSQEFRAEFPRAQNTPIIRKTIDKQGNTYLWRADKMVHADMERLLAKKYGMDKSEFSQNNEPVSTRFKRPSWDQMLSDKEFVETLDAEGAALVEELMPELAKDLKRTHIILTPDGGNAIGMYRSGEGITVVGGQNISTYSHEIAHAFFDMFTTETEKKSILKAVMKKTDIKDIAAAEEWLVEGFNSYRKRVSRGRTLVDFKGTRLTKTILSFFKKINRLISKHFVSNSEIDNFYAAITDKRRSVTKDEKFTMADAFKKGEDTDRGRGIDFYLEGDIILSPAEFGDEGVELRQDIVAKKDGTYAYADAKKLTTEEAQAFKNRLMATVGLTWKPTNENMNVFVATPKIEGAEVQKKVKKKEVKKPEAAKKEEVKKPERAKVVIKPDDSFEFGSNIVRDVQPDREGLTVAERRLEEIQDARVRREQAMSMLVQLELVMKELKGRVFAKMWEGQKVPTYFRTNNKHDLSMDEATEEFNNMTGGDINESGLRDWFDNAVNQRNALKEMISQAKEVMSKKVREETFLKAKIKSLEIGGRKGAQKQRKLTKEEQNEIYKTIKAAKLSLHDQGKLLANLKNIADIEKIQNRIDALKRAERINKAREKVAKELKYTKPVKQGATLKGKYDYASNKMFEELRKILKMNQSQALSALNQMPEEPGSVFEGIKKRLLSLQANGSTSSVALAEKVLADVQELKKQGEEAKNELDFEKRVEKQEEVKAVHEGIRGVRGVDKANWRTKTLNLIHKGFFDIYSALNRTVGKTLAEKYNLEEANLEKVHQTRLRLEQDMKGFAEALGVKPSQVPRMIAKMKSKKKTYVLERTDPGTGEKVKDDIDHTHIIDIYNAIKNDKTREDYYSAYGQEQIDGFVKKLSAEEKALGDYMQEQMQQDYDILNKWNIEKKGIDLGHIDNYWAATSLHIEDIFEGARVQGETAAAQKQRAKGRVIPIAKNAFLKYNKARLTAVHIETLSRAYEKVKRVLISPTVQSEITRKYGEDVYNHLNRLVDRLSLNAEQAKISSVEKIFGTALNNWVVAKIALNPSVFFKQLISVGNYMEVMNPATWTKWFAVGIARPIRTFNYMWKNVPELKTRFKMGYSEALQRVMSGASQASRVKQGYVRGLTFLVRVGDMGAIIYGGYPVMKDHLAKHPGDMAGAKKKFLDATTRSQQSGLEASLSELQQSKGVVRVLLAFKNTSTQYFRKLTNAFIAYGNGDISKSQLLKTVTIYGIIQPALYGAAGVAMRSLLYGSEPAEDEFFDEIMLQMAISPFRAIPVLDQAMDYAVRRLQGRNAWKLLNLPLFDDLNEIGQKLGKNNVTMGEVVQELASFTAEVTTGTPVKTYERIYKKRTEKEKDTGFGSLFSPKKRKAKGFDKLFG